MLAWPVGEAAYCTPRTVAREPLVKADFAVSGRPPRRSQDPLKYESTSTAGIEHAQPSNPNNRMHNRPEKPPIEGARPAAPLPFTNKVQDMSLKTDDLTGPKNFVPFYISRPRNTDPNNPAYQLPGQSTPLLTQGPPSPQRPPPERSSLDVSDITRVKLAPPPPLKSTARAPRPATARPCAASHSEDIVGAQPTAPRNFTHDPLDVSDITGNAVQRSSRPVSAAPRPTSTAACDDIAGASVRPRFDLSKVWAHPDFKYTEGSKAKSTVGSRRDHQDSSLRSADVLGAAPKHPAMPFISKLTRQPIGRARGIGSAAPRTALAAAAPSTTTAPPAPVAAAAAPEEVVAAPPPPAPTPTAAAEARMQPGATILQLSGQPTSAPSAESASSIAAASVQDTAAMRPLYSKLREMDREQCGLVTPAELSTAMAQCGAEVTPARVNELAAKYDTARIGYVNYPQLVQDALSPRGGTAPPLDALAKTAAGSLTVKPSALQASAAYPGTGQFGRPAAQGVRPIAAGAEQDKPHARDEISSRPSSAPMTRSAAARGVTFSEQQRTEQYCPTAHLVDAAAVHMEHMKNKRRPNSAFGVGLREAGRRTFGVYDVPGAAPRGLEWTPVGDNTTDLQYAAMWRAHKDQSRNPTGMVYAPTFTRVKVWQDYVPEAARERNEPWGHHVSAKKERRGATFECTQTAALQGCEGKYALRTKRGLRGTQNPGRTSGKGASRPASARTASATAAAAVAPAVTVGRRARPQSAAPQVYHSVRRSSVAPSAASLPMGQTKRHLQQLQSDIAVVRGLQ